MSWRIEQGDCLDVLRGMADASVDAVVCDPPYELNFMGKGWDRAGIANNVDLWREVLRVLKPGGHLFAFGGTRTYHRMTCAIEDAGFEIRDCVQWLYGSGFPKSLDIGKAIDKAAGAEREVVGPGQYMERRPASRRVKDGGETIDYHYGDGHAITAPATPAARQWDGWGTALKPAHEPIVLARKPIAGTVAANVQQYGTGALNIEAARVGTEAVEAGRGGRKAQDTGIYGRISGQATRRENAGRWPANLVLSHAPGCVRVGTKRVKGATAVRRNGNSGHGTFPVKIAPGSNDSGYADADGLETVDDWVCVEGCPVRALGEQSGERKARGACRHNTPGGVNKAHSYGRSKEPWTTTGYDDTGTAARFFTNLEPSPLDDVTPFLYTAKASRREREAGLEGMEEREPGPAGMYPKTPTCPVCGSHAIRPGPGRVLVCQCNAGVVYEEAERGHKGRVTNYHPTVKPVALMRWLVKLITPPGGLVLDPFAGSGTTGIACVLDGFGFVGIEQDADYCEIARRRIAHWERQATPAQPSLLEMTGD